jgi:mRNA-degrading endonuclease RelE of RelBE toxin-antitoxin system
MKFRMSTTFRRCLDGLPDEIRKAAKEKFQLFKDNPYYPYHPSLRIKPMKGFPGVLEGHITIGYVFTFQRLEDESGEIIFEFRKIGKHDIYNNP